MRTFTVIVVVLVFVAGAGWLAADDRAGDLEARVRALEARLPESGILEARGLVVKDEAGNERLVIDTRHPDTVRLRMLGAESKQRVLLEVDGHQQARIWLADREERVRLALSLIHGDAPYISLKGPAGTQKSMRIEAPNEGAVGLGMWGGPGKQNETSHAGFWVWEDGTIAFGGGIRSAGSTGFLMKYDRDGTGRFEVRDAEENVIWRMPGTE